MVNSNQGGNFTLTSYRYPLKTYADSKWVLTSPNLEGFLIKFADFKIETFGTSLTIGKGNDFKQKMLLFGSRDIVTHDNSSVIVLKENLIWIWFHIDDPATQTELLSRAGGYELNLFPSASGIQFNVTNISNGMIILTMFSVYSMHSL